ncbi:MAG TPA: hypothetical protein VHC44_14130 [Verrucomicrobiae bacterium]|nr:hypothetical protein [Verrucomicrobiae bacterium]
MKNSIFRTGVRLAVLAVFLKSLTAVAQVFDNGVSSAMIKLFGDDSFTAQAEIKVMNSNHVVWLQMPGAFASSDTKLRLDVDVKLIKSSSIPAAMIGMFVQAGKDRVTSAIRPDKKVTYIIYPNARTYSIIPMSPVDAEIANQKLEKKPLGKETFDGHPCVRNLSTVKSPRGAVLLTATTWNATDLKDFPIQIEMKENGNSTIMHFMNVKLGKPDPRLFDIPAGFKEEGGAPAKTAPPAKKK